MGLNSWAFAPLTEIMIMDFLSVVAVVLICTFIHIIIDKSFPGLERFKEYRITHMIWKGTTVFPSSLVLFTYSQTVMSQESEWYAVISVYSAWVLAVGLSSLILLILIDHNEKRKKKK